MILFPYEAPDPARERQDLIAYAEAGHAPYQRALAHCYRIGDELTQQDYAEAIRWYRRAAEQGDAAAQNDLGSMYLNGFGVTKDTTEAARWYRKSAEQGVAIAQFNYAVRCLHGDGVERDDAEAVLWLSKAADQGHIAATGLLGTCYRFARGVKRNTVLAAQLHVKAARAGDVVSMGNLIEYRKAIEQHALIGNVRAALCLVTMYHEGVVVQKNAAVALAWILWAEKHGRRDDDLGVRHELFELRLAFDSELSVTNKDEAYRLLGLMPLHRPG